MTGLPITRRGGFFRPSANSAVGSILLALAGLIFASELDLKQVAYLNRGLRETYGRVVPYRLSPDSSPLLVFHGAIPYTWSGVYFYRWIPYNRYRLVKVDTGNMGSGLVPGNMMPWAAGDVDGDSHPELLAHNGEYYPNTFYLLVALYVNPLQGLCPDSLAWRYRYDSAVAYGNEPFYITDLDGDDRAEIVAYNWVHRQLFVFENAGPDSFRLVWTSPLRYAYRYAFGDFDEDGRMEFATAGIDYSNWVNVLKCTGDDQYVLWDSVAIHLPNGHDVFSGRNLDGSNRAVFFVSFVNYDNYHTYLYMFEPTQGTRGYEAVLIDSSVFTGWMKFASSCCADVDGDSIEELFWSCGSHLSGYRKTGPRQFEQVWYWWNQDSSSANLTAYDVNGNGYNELIMSGDGRTFIFETEAIRVLNPDTARHLASGDTCTICWSLFQPPRCDSVSLFLRTDTAIVNGFYRLDTIAHGLSPNESTYSWVVPDTTLDSARILAIAYGPGWQFDESDSPFRIAPPGIAGPRVELPRDWALSVSPTPARGTFGVTYDVPRQGRVSVGIYDVDGRLVAPLADGVVVPGRYRARLSTSTLSAGVYFVRLDNGAERMSRKVVLTD